MNSGQDPLPPAWRGQTQPGFWWVPIGSSFIAIGLGLTPWVLTKLWNLGGEIEYFPFKIALWTFALFMVSLGLTILLTRKSHLPKQILLAMVGMLSIMVALEVLLRFSANVLRLDRPDFKRARILYEFQRTTQYHPNWGWSFLPDVVSVWEEDWKLRERSPMRIGFNTLPIPGYPEYGMRDDGLDPNVPVIPVFGDSFTFGSTVELEEIWVEIIERHNPGIDMLNLAGGGGLTKAVEQYAILRDKLPVHETVIYQMWLGNEFFDNYAFPIESARVSQLARKHTAETQKRRLETSSYLAYVAFEAIDNFLKSIEPSNSDSEYVAERDSLWDETFGNFNLDPANPILLRYTEPEFSDHRIVEGIENTRSALEEMKELAENRTLIVLLFPFKEQLYEEVVLPERPQLDLNKPNHIVLEICNELDITCLDLLPALKQYRSEKLFWDFDPHFNRLGHRYAALEAENRLRDLGVIALR